MDRGDMLLVVDFMVLHRVSLLLLLGFRLINPPWGQATSVRRFPLQVNGDFTRLIALTFRRGGLGYPGSKPGNDLS